jgi:hypothetical protein
LGRSDCRTAFIFKPAKKAIGSLFALWPTNGSVFRFALGPESFRGWQERTPYDELRYLKSLQKRRSPFCSNTLPNPTPKLFE